MPEAPDRLEPLSFSRRGRSLGTAAALAAYALFIGALAMLGTRPWLLALLALPALPALLDLVTDRRAGLVLAGPNLSWFSGRRTGTMRLGAIERVRFDRRWDLSVRVTLVATDGSETRLPAESLPPHRDLETALVKRGIHTERHHFSVF